MRDRSRIGGAICYSAGRVPKELEATARLNLLELRQPTLSALWDGGGVSKTLPSSGPVVLGRGAEAEVDLEHASLSRRHAVLHLDDRVEIEDLGSANGTRVRGRRIAKNERVAVAWGEAIELGAVLVIVRPGATTAIESATAEIAGSPPSGMADVHHLLDLAAPTDISVLLLGETGVGKGFFAESLHNRSKRAGGPWLHLNCAALPENLLESELFGYERGAFTGATQSKQGLLEAASGGTVFLDEVGDLPMSTQGKLLIALERREVARIGALKPRPFDVRFISATNRALEADAERGAYRADLYYRLAGLPITVPPLRERRDEIASLAQVFLRQSSARIGRSLPRLSARALNAMTAFDWPGNVRQLGTVIERALLWCTDVIEPEHLMLGKTAIKGPPPPGEPPASHAGALGTPRAGPPVEPPPSQRSLREDVDAIERKRITEALDGCGGNQVRAAEMLGISRRTLINRMVQYGMPRPRKG